MRRVRTIFSLCIAAFVAASLIPCACSKKSSSVDSTDRRQIPKDINDYTPQARAWADSIVADMDTTELIGQLVMPASYTLSDAATVTKAVKYVRDDKVGGLVWLKGDTASMRLLADTLSRVSRVPLFQAIDAEWGLAMRLEGATAIPRNPALAAASPELLFDYGTQVADEARRLGLNVILAPVLDVASVEGSAMRRRSYGADPAVVAEQGSSFASGIASRGVMPVAKHFPGLGATRIDTHESLPTVGTPRKSLDSIDLLPFRRYISQETGGIMTGHIYLPALDSIRRPATLSPLIVNGLLRDSLHFRGLVFTDAMNMRAMQGSGHRPYVEALLAGADLLIVPEDTHAAIAEIKGAIADGALPLSMVRDKVRRILFRKYILQMPHVG